MKITLLDVRQAEQDAEQLKEAFLRQQGWEYTCDTPGSVWVWVKPMPEGDKRLFAMSNTTSAFHIEEGMSKPEDSGYADEELHVDF